MQLFKVTYKRYDDEDTTIVSFVIASNEKDAKCKLQNTKEYGKIHFIKVSQLTYYGG